MERVNALPALAARNLRLTGAERADVSRRGTRAGRTVGSLIIAIGIMLAGGSWLLMFDETPYYVLSGIGYVVSGLLLWRRRPAGAWIAVALFAATVGWALWEVGLHYWPLFPRVLPPAGLAFLALVAALRFPENNSWLATARAAGIVALLILVQLDFAFVPRGVIHTSSSRAFVSAAQFDEASD